MNFGPHTHLELSGPSFELITILKNFCQKLSKNWVTFGGDLLEMDPIFKIFTPALNPLAHI